MDNQDKIFNQIKSAAEKAETKDFPSMDKIWNRVEEKLDQKALKKERKLWKKIAVAASVLLLVSVGYQLFKNPENITNPENEITVKDSLKTPNPSQFDKQNAVVESEITNPIIKKEAAAILEKQISTQNLIVNKTCFWSENFLTMKLFCKVRKVQGGGGVLNKSTKFILVSKTICPPPPENSCGSPCKSALCFGTQTREPQTLTLIF